jgi:hypothetical protein
MCLGLYLAPRIGWPAVLLAPLLLILGSILLFERNTRFTMWCATLAWYLCWGLAAGAMAYCWAG